MGFTKKFSDVNVYRNRHQQAKCKYCNKRGVHWAHTQWGYLLFEKKTGKRHKCR